MPQNFKAIGTSATSTVLTWGTSVVSNSGKVTGYEVYENGKALASTTNTGFIVTGLNPATAYLFTVAADDVLGRIGAIRRHHGQHPGPKQPATRSSRCLHPIST